MLISVACETMKYREPDPGVTSNDSRKSLYSIRTRGTAYADAKASTCWASLIASFASRRLSMTIPKLTRHSLQWYLAAMFWLLCLAAPRFGPYVPVGE